MKAASIRAIKEKELNLAKEVLAREEENLNKETAETKHMEKQSDVVTSERLKARHSSFITVENNGFGIRPDCLSAESIGIGIFGLSGAGKSSLWNGLTKGLFNKLVPRTAELHSLLSAIPHAGVGALETTRSIQSYTVPGKNVTIVDNPGHGTMGVSSLEYSGIFGVPFYWSRLYVYSGRLLESDARIIFSWLISGMEVVVVRQKFRQDLASFAKEECQSVVSDGFDFLCETAGEAETAFSEKMKSKCFQGRCKSRLLNELQKSLQALLKRSPDGTAVWNSKKMQCLPHEVKLYCVDSNQLNRYDGPALLRSLLPLRGESQSNEVRPSSIKLAFSEVGPWYFQFRIARKELATP